MADKIIITEHPKNQCINPGEMAKLTVKTLKHPSMCQWYQNGHSLPIPGDGYHGADTPSLVINKCFSKHKGVYHCVLTSGTDEEVISNSATLTIGELMFFTTLMFQKLCL